MLCCPNKVRKLTFSDIFFTTKVMQHSLAAINFLKWESEKQIGIFLYIYYYIVKTILHCIQCQLEAIS